MAKFVSCPPGESICWATVAWRGGGELHCICISREELTTKRVNSGPTETRIVFIQVSKSGQTQAKAAKSDHKSAKVAKGRQKHQRTAKVVTGGQKQQKATKCRQIWPKVKQSAKQLKSGQSHRPKAKRTKSCLKLAKRGQT
eukprot:EG_transcript_15356